jgi:hypothetical protein
VPLYLAWPFGQQAPWQVKDILFVYGEPKSKELHIQLDFPAGVRFPDETGVPCPVHDKVGRE